MKDYHKEIKSFFPEETVCSSKKDKKALRAFYGKKVSDLSTGLKQKKQKQIVKLLNQLPIWTTAGWIAVYRALKDEPCLSNFYNSWIDKVCFPVIQDDILEFYKSSDKWSKNSFNVFEPAGLADNHVPLEDISVFLVPGRVFDRRGGRLGRGQAYYDKCLNLVRKRQTVSLGKVCEVKSQGNFLRQKQAVSLRKEKTLKRSFPSSFKKALFIGVAFSDQIHNEYLKLFPHDVLMDILVTDRFVLQFFNQRKFSKGR